MFFDTHHTAHAIDDNQGEKPSAHLDISELTDDGDFGVLWFLHDPELFGKVDVASALAGIAEIQTVIFGKPERNESEHASVGSRRPQQ